MLGSNELTNIIILGWPFLLIVVLIFTIKGSTQFIQDQLKEINSSLKSLVNAKKEGIK